MSRHRLAAGFVALFVVGTLLSSGALAPNVRAVTAARPVRRRARLGLFGLDPPGQGEPGSLRRRPRRMADSRRRDVGGPHRRRRHRVDRPVRRASADYQGCADIKLLGDAAAVAHFAECLRSVASAYRKGLDPALTKKIGVDTNYVAAMEQAAKHLPADAVRPAVILFTDGKHDVAGVPASQVPPALDRLFGSRSPVAVLPVGMGLEAERTRRARGRARRHAHHPRHARVRQRRDVRLAAGRVRVGRRRGQRRRGRAPGRDLHVHRRRPRPRPSRPPRAGDPGGAGHPAHRRRRADRR